MTTAENAPSGKPGKYNRSFGGLVGALIVTAAVILVVLFVMGLFRNETATDVERIDLDEAVEAAQEGGLDPVYPAELPDGWVATALEVPQDEIGGLTEIRLLVDPGEINGSFIGIRLAAAVTETRLLKLIDEETDNVESIAPYSSDGDLGLDWAGYAAGEDSAYVALLGNKADEIVIVYGSAPAEDLQTVIDQLTRRPLQG